jgi:hypothetical protein
MGAALALPLLEGMLPLTALAQSAKAPAKRVAFLFVPNGIHMPDWTPATEGANFALPYLLEPLKNVRSSLTVLTGLTQDKARANGDGGGDHARSAAAWLTGCQPRKTAGANIKAGISADQLAARAVGKQTKFASLELGCERGGMAGDCDSGYSCAYSNSISWRGEATPVAKEVDPRLVFERLFGVLRPERDGRKPLPPEPLQPEHPRLRGRGRLPPEAAARAAGSAASSTSTSPASATSSSAWRGRRRRPRRSGCRH